jgi:TonB family protein
MNRLQKKCVLATVGIHLLLLVILIVGPAFFTPSEKPDTMPALDVIPANLIDAQLNSGVRHAQPPKPVVQPAPRPPAPQPVVKPPPPAPQRIEKPEPVRETRRTPEPRPEHVEKAVEHPPHTIVPNTRLTTRTEPTHSTPTKSRDDSRERAEALRNAIETLKNNFAPSTTIDMPGNSSVSYANYAQVVKSIYEQAWLPPDNAQNDDANVKVTVTIARDGTVLSARILSPSGDAGVDASVQHTLERVQFIAPFPAGATEKERTYIINFNLKAKRMLG